MSATEFEGWKAFYRMFPFDDLHRYHRPAAAIGVSCGGTYDKLMDFLAPEPIPPGMTQADWNTMKAFRNLGVGPPRKKDA